MVLADGFDSKNNGRRTTVYFLESTKLYLNLLAIGYVRRRGISVEILVGLVSFYVFSLCRCCPEHFVVTGDFVGVMAADFSHFPLRALHRFTWYASLTCIPTTPLSICALDLARRGPWHHTDPLFNIHNTTCRKIALFERASSIYLDWSYDSNE